MNKFTKLIILGIALCLLNPTLLFAQLAWTQATASAEWTPRCNHTSVVFDNKIWVIGGWDGTYKNDVWYSENGIHWTCATSNAEWSGRYRHASVVFDNKIWVMGGGAFSNVFLRDVWYSTDGVNWICATTSAPWANRQGLAAVVFDNKMWVLGGWYLVYEWPPLIYYYNDVWYSTDGVTWTPATYNANWIQRYAHSSVVFDNKMWVLGGNDPNNPRNDVWYSTDGVNWMQATPNAQWSPRAYHTTVAFDDKIWIMGGAGGGFQNDIWFSTNGANWTQAISTTNWTARDGHTSVVFDNKMWVLGGYDGNRRNDVWCSPGLFGTEETYVQHDKNHLPATIFPNPATSVVRVRAPFSVNKVTIYDVSGKMVKEIALPRNDQTVRVSLAGINNGVYFVKINDVIVKEKLIITK
ncbi:MAG: kelch repeat-containing protein [candidate division WOR-3 bacterium]